MRPGANADADREVHPLVGSEPLGTPVPRPRLSGERWSREEEQGEGEGSHRRITSDRMVPPSSDVPVLVPPMYEVAPAAEGGVHAREPISTSSR